VLEKMKEEYVQHNGAEEYAQKRAKLMNTLMDVGVEDDVSTGVSTNGVSTKTMSELDNSV
jgi:hypothetical protein